MLAPGDVIRIWWNGDHDCVYAEVVPDAAAGAYPLQPRRLPWQLGPEFLTLGARPPDLALSILTACVGADLAERWYREFRADVLAPDHPDFWTLSAAMVQGYVEQLATLSGNRPAVDDASIH